MAAPTAEELLAAVTTAAKAVAEGKVSAFRENEDSANFIALSQYAQLMRAVSDENVQNAINAASQPKRPKFRYLC